MPDMQPHLPRVTDGEPSVATDAVGRALRGLYEDLVAEGVPDHLADLVHRFDDRIDSATGEKQLAIIVEDDPELRDLARAILEETSLGVITCATGEAALATLQARGAAVVFMFIDVRLSGMIDGVDLARAVSKLWPQVRVILTSGAPEESLQTMPEGAVFIPKPWRALRLLVEAERSLAQPQPRVL
jgi:CheY-like chemotaxis protein